MYVSPLLTKMDLSFDIVDNNRMTRANKHIGSATEMTNQREHLIGISITKFIIDQRATLEDWYSSLDFIEANRKERPVYLYCFIRWSVKCGL